MKEIKLPSGAILKIGHIPMAPAKALYQALLLEAKGLSIQSQTEIASIVKDLFCLGFSSPKIEAALSECLKRCLYVSDKGELRIDEQTFEPMEARQDYTLVCIEVMMETIHPFVKSLSAELPRLIGTITSFRA